MSEIWPKKEEIITEILMSRENKPWFVIEGDTDANIFRERRFIDTPKVVVGKGWENVRDIVYACKGNSLGKIIGLIDRDYRDFLGCQVEHEGIILTDLRDIENIIFNSSAFERVFSEVASPSKLPRETNGSIDKNAIFSKILSITCKLGKFRIFLQEENINLSMKEIDYTKFIDDRTLEIDVDVFIRYINGKSKNGVFISKSHWEKSQRKNWEDEFLNSPFMISNGHDIMGVISVAFRRKWASLGGDSEKEVIEKYFRLSFSDTDLEKTYFWNSIQKKMQ